MTSEIGRKALPECARLASSLVHIGYVRVCKAEPCNGVVKQPPMWIGGRPLRCRWLIADEKYRPGPHEAFHPSLGLGGEQPPLFFLYRITQCGELGLNARVFHVS